LKLEILDNELSLVATRKHDLEATEIERRLVPHIGGTSLKLFLGFGRDLFGHHIHP
jgi:hypothetical protein